MRDVLLNVCICNADFPRTKRLIRPRAQFRRLSAELMAACAARAARYGFGFVRNTAAPAFHVFYRLQVAANFHDAPLLQSAPNRPDYIHIWALWLHGHQFVAAFALEWQTDRVIANIFIALPLFEISSHKWIRFGETSQFQSPLRHPISFVL